MRLAMLLGIVTLMLAGCSLQSGREQCKEKLKVRIQGYIIGWVVEMSSPTLSEADQKIFADLLLVDLAYMTMSCHALGGGIIQDY